MPIEISEIRSKSILRKQKKVDSWFASRYSMNLYRGCVHNCAYCDGRAEKYQVKGEFGRHVEVKTNAIELLRRELDPSRKRKPRPRGFILVGGGVCDSYQPEEKKYQLTRGTLQLLLEHDFPVHMLTKSTLIERDMDLLDSIREKNGAIISMSFSTVNDKISAHFEPGAAPPSRRLKTLERFKVRGFPIGIYLMPVIPFVTDMPEKIRESVKAAKDIGVDFIIFGGMTLKEGRQKQYYYDILKAYDASLLNQYDLVYQKNNWGEARPDYYNSIHAVFSKIAAAYHVPMRIPPHLWMPHYDANDRVVVILEHIDYLLKLQGRTSHYGRAAYSIATLDQPISLMRERLEQLPGIGSSTARLIRELLDTGQSKYYEWLLFGAAKK